MKAQDLPPAVITGILKQYMQELKEGGYSDSWREDALASAMTGYERMWGKEVRGEGKVNRPASSTTTHRRWKRLCGRSKWFQPGGKEP